MSKFQLILLGVFGFFIVGAVLLFSLARGNSNTTSLVTVWGPVPAGAFNSMLYEAGYEGSGAIEFRYVEKNLGTIEQDFTEALALGEGPDLIILPSDKYWHAKSKLRQIPYTSFSEAEFRSAFTEGGEVFLTSTGTYALPIYIDPLVMYYNRDILTNAGVAEPIDYWDELYAATLRHNKRDGAGNITQSTIALGEWQNIPHYKDIFSLLLLQAGTPIMQFVGQDSRAGLLGNFNQVASPAESALDFYTQFSNPSKTYYSWNRSLLPAQTHFTSGESAYYLGYASELSVLRSKNPTLNLGIATVPQSRVGTRSLTFGKIYGVAVSRGSKNPTAAFTGAYELVTGNAMLALSQAVGLPPAGRGLLSKVPGDAYNSVFYKAGLQTRAWRDPDDTLSKLVFREMIDSVISGRARTSEAVTKAHWELDGISK